MGESSGVGGLWKPVWAMGTSAAILAAYTGNAEPYVAASALPGGGAPNMPLYMFGAIALVSFGGLALPKLVTPNAWSQMREETDLTLEDDTFTGSIDGRTVRARTERRKVGGDRHGTNYATFTVVEADLTRPTTAAAIVGVTDGETGLVEFGENLTTESTVVDDEFVVIGDGAADLGPDLLTTRARAALRAIDTDSASLGDASETISRDLAAASDSMLGGLFEGAFEEKFDQQFGGSERTVAISTRDRLGDPAELDRRTEAVAAVADAFEAARPPEGPSA